MLMHGEEYRAVNERRRSFALVFTTLTVPIVSRLLHDRLMDEAHHPILELGETRLKHVHLFVYFFFITWGKARFTTKPLPWVAFSTLSFHPSMGFSSLTVDMEPTEISSPAAHPGPSFAE